MTLSMTPSDIRGLDGNYFSDEQRNMQRVLQLLESSWLSFGDLIEEVMGVVDAPGA